MIEKLNKKLQEQFDKMCSTGKLFRSEVAGHDIWQMYIKSFRPEDNPVFRSPDSTTHNCNLCHNFMNRYGNIVAIDEDYKIMSIFDVEGVEEYQKSVSAISKLLKKSKIANVFFETFKMLNFLPYESCTKNSVKFKLGIDKNVKRYTKEEAELYGVVKPNEIRTFKHFHLYLPEQFVDKSDSSIESIMGEYRDSMTVFKRAMDEISLDTLNLVRDLINQGSLLDGQTHLYKIEQMIPLVMEYDSLPAKVKRNWCWIKSYKFALAKFKNELIGVLCSELSEGVELNKACQSWNKRVDPINYMKTVAPITKKQIEEAKKFVIENGYEESFTRRYATIDDIKVTEIKHINIGNGKIKSVSIFDSVKSISTRHKRSEFDNVEEVSIEKFMKDILPECTAIEVYLSNKLEGNLVSLTTASNEESKPIFKYSNNYSKTFNGNLAGKSEIKTAVKNAGGRVDGVLRFSIIWNDYDGSDNSDLDAWCEQPNMECIGYSTPFRKDRSDVLSPFSGQLDLDNTNPSGKMAIENIYFKDIKKLRQGIYRFWVNQFADRGSKGFKAEIECDGEIYSYEYNQRVNRNVAVANVIYKDGKFTVEHKLPETTSSRELYGLQSNQFHKVNLVCLSPNYWGKNSVGNKYYLFMLEGCKCPVSIRSFHIEDLLPELLKHKRVLEVLGNTTMIEPTDGKQLSGVGFNATVRDELIVRLQGTFKRIIKIKF